MKKLNIFFYGLLLAGVIMAGAMGIETYSDKPDSRSQEKPNIVLIYADDLGYGDLSCYGATKIQTPNIDKLAAQSLRFTNAHATSATCTPSRFSLLTGKYAWRKQGTGIAPGDAALLIPTDIVTLPDMLQKAGYKTGVVGKWHLGLGPKGGPAWNEEIKPGPLEIGFDYSFIIPATGDRVPCVYVENHRIAGLDPADPVQVSYKGKVGDEPTGKENPGLLKMHPSHGHDQTIVNGISRIGYMSGGESARWVDEEMANVITGKAIDFIKENKEAPFFLYFATHDIHVPRVPHSRFAGKSGMGPRGDAILQLDWTVGRVMEAIGQMGLAKSTIVIFSSDNGPVIDDGYKDHAVEKLNGHRPSGLFRGGKYSAFEAGTRIPFIVRWPDQIKPGTSEALISQIDLFASFAALTGQEIAAGEAPDSFNMIETVLDTSHKGREFLVEQSLNNTLSLIMDQWKYIEPGKGPRVSKNTHIELGNNPEPQLYNLREDAGETDNVAQSQPGVLEKMRVKLEEIKNIAP